MAKYHLIHSFLFRNIKWRISAAQFISQNTQTPVVHFSVKWSIFDNLRAKVVRCTTKGFSLRGWWFDRPTKITQFKNSLISNHDILRFDITMYDIFLLKINKSVKHLFHIFLYCCLIKFPFLFQQTIKISLSRILHHDVNLLLVKKETIHCEDILVFEMTVYLNLSSDLIEYLFLENFLFWKAL